jgi:hypothetical protein
MLTRRALLRAALWLPPALLVGCSGISQPATAWLDHTWPAALGGVMTFRLTVRSRHDLPNPKSPEETAAETFFSLLNGLSAVEPLDPEWVMTRKVEQALFYRRPVTLKGGIPQVFEMQVRLDQAGDLQISGGGIVIIRGQEISAGSDSLFLRVTPTGTQIQRTPFKA